MWFWKKIQEMSLSAVTQLMDKFDDKKFVPKGLKNYESYDPDYFSGLQRSFGRMAPWREALGKSDAGADSEKKIVLVTWVPADKVATILDEGLRIPGSHKVSRTDSAEAEENAIFATYPGGVEWKNRVPLEISVRVSDVVVRSTNFVSGLKRCEMNLGGFLSHERPPFDPGQVEFLIYQNIPSSSVNMLE